MARWGLGIFQSDADLDATNDIWAPVDLTPLKKDVIRLRLEDWEQERRKSKSVDAKDATEDELDDDEVDNDELDDDELDEDWDPNAKPSKEKLERNWESDVELYSPRFPSLVRDFLNSGVLASLIKEHGPKKAKTRWSEHQGHKNLVLIACCAMELGCTLPPGFLARLKSNYRRVGLIGDEPEQVGRACEEYVDGKPYGFVYLELAQAVKMSMDGQTQRRVPRPPGLEPIPSQEADTTVEEPAGKRRKVGAEGFAPAPAVERFRFEFSPDTCANCGATGGHGSPDLKRCKGCNTTLYCSEGCQKWHWIYPHRHHCKADQSPEGSTKHDSTDDDGDVAKEIEEATARDAVPGNKASSAGLGTSMKRKLSVDYALGGDSFLSGSRTLSFVVRYRVGC